MFFFWSFTQTINTECQMKGNCSSHARPRSTAVKQAATLTQVCPFFLSQLFFHDEFHVHSVFHLTITYSVHLSTFYFAMKRNLLLLFLRFLCGEKTISGNGGKKLKKKQKSGRRFHFALDILMQDIKLFFGFYLHHRPPRMYSFHFGILCLFCFFFFSLAASI